MRSPKLEELRFTGHVLTTGLWAQTARRLREMLCLKTVELNQLYGGFPDPPEMIEYMNLFSWRRKSIHSQSDRTIPR